MDTPTLENFTFRPHPNVADAIYGAITLPNGANASVIAMLPWGVRSGGIDPAGCIQIGGDGSTYELMVDDTVYSWATEDEVNAHLGCYCASVEWNALCGEG